MEKWILYIAIVLGTLLVTALLVWPIMWLWNWIMPIVFGLPILTYWQTFAIWILSGVFFKNFNTTTSGS